MLLMSKFDFCAFPDKKKAKMLNGKNVFSIYFAFPKKKRATPSWSDIFLPEKKLRKKLMDCGDARGGKMEDGRGWGG